jgi:uncharacterized membrane protein YecN with MAPEG domain
MNLPVTLLYGGLTALLVTLLGLNVTRLRFSRKAGLKPPLPPELIRPWRAHGNAAEWVPLGLVLLLMLELSGRVPRFQLHLLGGSFLLARGLHAVGLLTRWRVSTLGAGLNYLVLLVMALLALGLRISA